MSNPYRSLKQAVMVVAAICVVIIILNYILNGRMTWQMAGATALYSMYYGFPLTILNGQLFAYLDKVSPWEEKPRRRAYQGVMGSVAVTMLTLIMLNFILWSLIQGNSISVLWLKENRSFYVTALVITVVVTTTLHAIGFFKEVQREKQVNAQLRQEKLLTELSALRAHLDPHFLFNSFNVLSGLIEEDKEKAQEFLSGLSKIYRYILEQRNEHTSTVAEELSFAQQYLHLQKMRFEDSIHLKTAISPEALDRRIPSLSLQLLLENALKHNGFDELEPLDIRIKEEADTLLVSNNRKARKNISTAGNGIGLQNIRDRYALLTDKKPEVEAKDDSFTVKLPLI